MSRKEITQFYDDLDNSLISEDELEVIRFSINGSSYLLDLSPANAEKFHAALEPFVEAARPAPESTPRRSNPGEIRAWAREKGIDVAQRGKIPHEVIQAFNKANRR